MAMQVQTTSGQLFIGGAWHDSLEDATTGVINPATATPFGTVPACSVADAGFAVEAAGLPSPDHGPASRPGRAPPTSNGSWTFCWRPRTSSDR
jgi:hypothetical protein